MAVDALYLFNEKKQIRKVIVWGIYELIHDEGSYELDAEIDAACSAKPGQFLGFFGIDKKFLLFEIDKAEDDVRRGVTMITATDAAVAELAHLVVPEVRLTGVTARVAAEAALDGSGYTLGNVTESDTTADLSFYYEKRWKVLKELAVQWQVRVTAYYDFDGTQITGKHVDVTARDNVFRGRLFEGSSGTTQIYVARSGSPVTRLYGIGKATGEEDPPTCVTFADVAWSKANGDPIDKPLGQTYIEDADAITLYGEGREDVFNDKYEEDAESLLEKTWEKLQKLKAPAVSGTASASDMEHIPGHEHKIVRMYDLVYVRTKSGEDVSAVVINVKRNYLRRGLTKFTVGEETDDSGLIKKIASLSSTTSELSSTTKSQSNRLIITRQLVQVNADTIQLNARLIEANTEMTHITASNLAEYQEGTDERLATAELLLYGDETGAYAGLAATVEENTAAILLQANELESIATIKADRIELEGFVTASQLAAELAALENGIASEMYIGALSCGTFSIGGTPISFSRKSVATGGSIKAGATSASYQVTSNGEVIGSVIVPSTWVFTPTTSTIYYLGWE